MARRSARLLATALLASVAAAAPAAVPFRAGAAVDARGFIDVWALRRDVIAVESLQPTTDEDRCSPEAGPDDRPLPRRQARRLEQAAQRCAARARRELERFQAARLAFNQAWLPAIRAAIANGDAVAEVVFLLCETTLLLDRGDAVSTCQPATEDAARTRLREIGFEAAYTPCEDPAVVTWHRAFRFCTGRFDTWPSDGFRRLSLNRPRALAPGQLSWGREHHHSGSPSPYTGLNFYEPSAQARAEKDREIDRILQQEPRWGVFLLTRVGRHEWVPAGSSSSSGRLAPAWAGRYRLMRGAGHWTEPLQPMSGVAEVRTARDGFRITIESGAAAPLADVTDCRLRYSGGLTYLPELTASGRQSAQRTALGYFYEGGGWKAGSFWDDGAADAALAPLAVHKRYR